MPEPAWVKQLAIVLGEISISHTKSAIQSWSKIKNTILQMAKATFWTRAKRLEYWVEVNTHHLLLLIETKRKAIL